MGGGASRVLQTGSAAILFQTNEPGFQQLTQGNNVNYMFFSLAIISEFNKKKPTHTCLHTTDCTNILVISPPPPQCDKLFIRYIVLLKYKFIFIFK